MSESEIAMVQEVIAKIYGGKPYSTATQAYYRNAHDVIQDYGRNLYADSASWNSAVMRITTAQSQSWTCPYSTANPNGGATNPLVAHPPTDASFMQSHTHEHVDYTHLVSLCRSMAQMCCMAGKQCEALADAIARAYSLYADAEMHTRQAIDTSMQTLTAFHPMVGAAMVAGAAGLGALSSACKKEKVTAIDALNGTTLLQQGTIAGVGALLTKQHNIAYIHPSDNVNQAAAMLAAPSSHVNDVLQGSRLELTQVKPRGNAPIGQAHTMKDALHQLHEFGSAAHNGKQGLSYGTIAISQYQRNDGSISWLVSVPGTDGHKDSPFGWEQNLEAMSADSTQRRMADSTAMVASAMRSAGIQPHDHVAIIGHSQGGIVAASLASDMSDEFSIEHIVTAGSPIAHHPIDSHTWVTSVEMDNELVASLDGADNPAHESWLTIRGSAMEKTHNDAIHGVQVHSDSSESELTHDLKYHEAALQDALNLHSPALEEHDQHFNEVLHGQYVQTTYWQGRMKKDD